MYSTWSTWSFYSLDQFLNLANSTWILSKFLMFYQILLLSNLLVLMGGQFFCVRLLLCPRKPLLYEVKLSVSSSFGIATNYFQRFKFLRAKEHYA